MLLNSNRGLTITKSKKNFKQFRNSKCQGLATATKTEAKYSKVELRTQRKPCPKDES